MNNQWAVLYHAAKAVQNDRNVSDMVSAGGAAAAIESESGRIYVGGLRGYLFNPWNMY